MKKRIEELAKQANIWKPTHDHKTWVPGEYIASPGELEKFAELLIRECVLHLHRRGVEGFGILEERNLKEHFGVDDD